MPRSRARHRVLAFAFALAVVTYLDRICISAAAPFIMSDLGLTMLQMGAVFGAFTLAYSLFEVPSGWRGDVVGARRVLTRIVLWWSGFTMLTGAAWSLRSLVAIRFLFGAGEAGAFPNLLRSFSRWFPARERGRANGVLFLGSRLGGALAPPLAMLLIRRWGWRLSFVVFGAAGIAWAVAWRAWYRDDPARHPSVDPEELAWIRQDPAPPPTGDRLEVPWRRLFTSPNLYAVCGMYFAFGYGLYFYFTWLPTYLIRGLGFSALAGGLLAGLPFVLAGGADLLGGWLTDRLSLRYGLRVGRCYLGGTAFGGCALLLVASTRAASPTAKALLLALALAGADLALPACWAVCLDIGARHAGVVTGAMNTLGNLGGFVGPLVVGYAVERGGSWSVPFSITAAVYALGALLWLVIDPNRPLLPLQGPSRGTSTQQGVNRPPENTRGPSIRSASR
jgi:ACS family glucarate transporter-like MFS transporter